MKCLFLHGLKRETEAFSCIKIVLMKNMANMQVWHVYGMLNRSSKNYDMARKSYINAIKFAGKKDTVSVLSDLSQL